MNCYALRVLSLSMILKTENFTNFVILFHVLLDIALRKHFCKILIQTDPLGKEIIMILQVVYMFGCFIIHILITRLSHIIYVSKIKTTQLKRALLISLKQMMVSLSQNHHSKLLITPYLCRKTGENWK